MLSLNFLRPRLRELEHQEEIDSTLGEVKCISWIASKEEIISEGQIHGSSTLRRLLCEDTGNGIMNLLLVPLRPCHTLSYWQALL